MSTSDNFYAPSVEITLRLRPPISDLDAELLAKDQQVAVSGRVTSGAFHYVPATIVSSIRQMRSRGGAESSHGSEYVSSRKGSTKRKATKSGKKS